MKPHNWRRFYSADQSGRGVNPASETDFRVKLSVLPKGINMRSEPGYEPAIEPITHVDTHISYRDGAYRTRDAGCSEIIQQNIVRNLPDWKLQIQMLCPGVLAERSLTPAADVLEMKVAERQ